MSRNGDRDHTQTNQGQGPGEPDFVVIIGGVRKPPLRPLPTVDEIRRMTLPEAEAFFLDDDFLERLDDEQFDALEERLFDGETTLTINYGVNPPTFRRFSEDGAGIIAGLPTRPTLTPPHEATHDQIVSTLRRLLEEGGDHNFVAFVAVKTGGRSAYYYVQFAASCGSAEIYGEAVSNYYLERPFTLGKRQKAELGRLGWNPPRRGRSPNYYRHWQALNDRDLHEIAATAIATLKSVYGWPGDKFLEVELHLDW